VTIVRECEDGTLVGNMRAQADGSAFGGQYVDTPASEPEFRWESSSPSLPPSRSEIGVTLPRDGTYYLWIRIYADSGDDDRLYAGFDAADMKRLFPPTGAHGAWHWQHDDPDGGDLLVFDLRAGAQTLVVGAGEPLARCDRIVLTTDDAYVASSSP
jgi:hypothetical protein